MPIDIEVVDVELVDNNDVRITTDLTSSDGSISYGGAVSTADTPAPDNTRISGSVSGTETVEVTLGTGLEDDDLPEEILVTVALDEGPARGYQQQVDVLIEEQVSTPGDDIDVSRTMIIGGGAALVLLIAALAVVA